MNALDGCGQHRVVVRNARAQAKGNPQIAGADEQAVDLGYRGNAFNRLQAGPGFDHRQRQHLRVGVLGVVRTPTSSPRAGPKDRSPSVPPIG